MTDQTTYRSTTRNDCPAVAIVTADERKRASMTYRLAARLELAATNSWYIAVDARGASLWIESSTDGDESDRRAALTAACLAEFGK